MIKRTKREKRMAHLDGLATEWLANNDPTYISPAQKASNTKATPYTSEALEKITGSGCFNSQGYELNPNYAFEGGSENNPGNIVPIDAAKQEQIVDFMRQTQTHKKGGNKKNQNRARRERKRAAKRIKVLGKRND